MWRLNFVNKNQVINFWVNENHEQDLKRTKPNVDLKRLFGFGILSSCSDQMGETADWKNIVAVFRLSWNTSLLQN